MGVVPKGLESTAEAHDDLFARRMARLEQVSILLRGLKRDYATCVTTEIQQKADIYNANMDVSHGERQGIANAQTVQIRTEIQQLKGQIDVLEEEAAFLRFVVQWTEG